MNLNGSINQRDYQSMQSTNRQFYSVQMSQVNTNKLGFNKLSRENSKLLFAEQQRMLQRSLSKQSDELYGSAKGRKYEERSYSSRGNVRDNPTFNYKNGNANKTYNSNNSKNNDVSDINKVVGNILATANADNKGSDYGDNKKQMQIQSEKSEQRFTLRMVSYLVEVALGYGIVIGMMYLVTATGFPFFQLLLVASLMLSIWPWSFTNVLVLVAWAVIIANYFLRIQALTYPIILICYFSVLIFNERHKNKIIFIPVLILLVVWGFIVIPSLFVQFRTILGNVQGFYYIFPLFVFMIRIFLYIAYKWIKFTEYIFLQLPFFILGLQYGVMMTLTVSSIEFWYLMVFFTLQIVNDRTQFMLKILVKVWKSCDNTIRTRKNNSKSNNSKNNINANNSLSMQNIKNDEQSQSQKALKTHEKDIPILHAHASGYSSIHSFHIVCIVYVFTKLPLYSEPYTSSTRLNIYIQKQFYIPLVIWVLGFAYEAMCLVLERKRRDILLIGYTNNGIVHTIIRAFMLALGLWMFYLGLGIGNYAVYGQNL